MAHGLQIGLRNGGLRRGGLRAGFEGGSIFNIASLDLNFARYKNIGSLVTFTRASSGTFVGSDGVFTTAPTNVPRFDHNPTTGESLGLLVEEQRTNLLLRSEEFDDAAWTLFGTASRTANTTVAPDGATTADSVTLPTSSGIFQLVNGSANTTYTFSVWIKCNTTQSVRLVINTNLSDPTTLTVTATSSWQRFSITKTTSVGTLTVGGQIDTGGGNTFFLWGAQLEAGAFPTSYIPTTTAAATRSADVASITGTAFTSWYRQDEGTAYWEGSRTTTTGFPDRFRFSDGTSANLWFLYWDAVGNSSTFEVITGSASQVAIFGGGSSLNSSLKAALGLATNNSSAVYAGNIQGTDTSVTLPTVSQVTIAAGLTGTIKRLTYWPTRLANTTLQTLTQ